MVCTDTKFSAYLKEKGGRAKKRNENKERKRQERGKKCHCRMIETKLLTRNNFDA
jgi:hypothetical protein